MTRTCVGLPASSMVWRAIHRRPEVNGPHEDGPNPGNVNGIEIQEMKLDVISIRPAGVIHTRQIPFQNAAEGLVGKPHANLQAARGPLLRSPLSKEMEIAAPSKVCRRQERQSADQTEGSQDHRCAPASRQIGHKEQRPYLQTGGQGEEKDRRAAVLIEPEQACRDHSKDQELRIPQAEFLHYKPAAQEHEKEPPVAGPGKTQTAPKRANHKI